MVPTAVDTAGGPGAGNQRSIRYAGRGRDDNNYTYDGIDATYIINQSQLYYVRAAIPLDTIDEIRVDPMLATAQTGRDGRRPVGPGLAFRHESVPWGRLRLLAQRAFSMPRIRSTL